MIYIDKICTICGIEKSLSEFYSQNKVKADGTPYIYYNPECKECRKEKTVQWQKDNPERLKEHYDRWNSSEKIKPVRKKLYNKEWYQAKVKKWRRENTDKISEYSKTREMNKKHEISNEEWENCKNYFNYRCAYCGLPVEEHYRMWYGKMRQFDLHREHVDHEGLNDLSNCVPACTSCNSSKWKHNLGDWYNDDNENFSQERLYRIYKWLNQDYLKYKE